MSEQLEFATEKEIKTTPIKNIEDALAVTAYSNKFRELADLKLRQCLRHI